jgi:hypothetical protein
MLKIPIHSHPFTTSRYYPMECLNIDFIGPYPDKSYVLVIIETFTRWVELFYSSAATGKIAALHLFQRFGRFGAPSQPLSDRGSHFVNEVITEFTSLVGTQRCLTLAYSSQQNSIVERVNKEINRHIRSLTFEFNSIEDDQLTLPIVQRILNAAYSDRTHLSSSQTYTEAYAINLHRSLFLPPVERPTQGHPLLVQDEVMERACTILQESDNLHTATSSAKVPTTFLPGTYVLVKYRNSSNLYPAPTRLHTYWKGPLKFISNVLSEYLLLDLITDKQKTYHVLDLKPFVFDPLNTDPLDIARRDYMEFFIKKILAMSADVKKVSTLDFHVK